MKKQQLLLFIHNGKADAFRHTYWNALDTADFGSVTTKMFTNAHEWNSGNHPLETEMDLYNNQKGRDIGANYSYTTPTSSISSHVTIYLTSGFLKYLAPLDNDGNIISGTQIKFTNQ